MGSSWGAAPYPPHPRDAHHVQLDEQKEQMHHDEHGESANEDDKTCLDLPADAKRRSSNREAGCPAHNPRVLEQVGA
jgi:hypothetical protein